MTPRSGTIEEGTRRQPVKTGTQMGRTLSSRTRPSKFLGFRVDEQVKRRINVLLEETGVHPRRSRRSHCNRCTRGEPTPPNGSQLGYRIKVITCPACTSRNTFSDKLSITYMNRNVYPNMQQPWAGKFSDRLILRDTGCATRATRASVQDTLGETPRPAVMAQPKTSTSVLKRKM